MIDYSKVQRGDVLKIVGTGAPGYAKLGDLVRVISVTHNSVKVEDKHGTPCEFVFNCGAARLEPTEWTKDFDMATGIQMLEEPRNKELGEKLYRLRTAHGLSTTEFAEKIGIGEEHIEKLEEGFIALSDKKLAEVAESLSVLPDLLRWFTYKKQESEVEYPEMFKKVNETMESFFDTCTRVIERDRDK